MVVEDRHRRTGPRWSGRHGRAPAAAACSPCRRGTRRRRPGAVGAATPASAPGSARRARVQPRPDRRQRHCPRACPRRSPIVTRRDRGDQSQDTDDRRPARSSGRRRAVGPHSDTEPRLRESVRPDRACRAWVGPRRPDGADVLRRGSARHGSARPPVLAAGRPTARPAYRLTPVVRLHAVTFVNRRVSGPASAGPAPVSFSPVATTERDFYEILGVERARVGRRHQARLPQARPAVAPGRQHGARRAHERFKEINEAYQVLSDPERRQRYDMFGPAGVDGGAAGRRRLRGLRRLRRHLRRVLRWRRAARRPRGAAGRSPAPTSATTCGSPSRRPSAAPRRRSSSPSSAAARRAAAAAPKPGTEPHHLPAVQRPRRGPQRPPDDARPDGQRHACPRCKGEGKIVETPCDDLPGRRPHRAQADAPGDDPGRHRRGPPDPAVERGRGRAARRPAGQPLRRGPRRAAPELRARGHRAVLRGRRLDRPGRARHADHGPDGRRRGGGRDQGRARSPDTEIRLRGKGVPHLRRAGPRGDLHVLVDVVVPTKLSKTAARAARGAYAEESGEAVGDAAAGCVEKLGLG